MKEVGVVSLKVVQYKRARRKMNAGVFAGELDDSGVKARTKA